MKGANFTLFREFLPVYYERLFVEFMDKKGMLPDGKESILAKRFHNNLKRDKAHSLEFMLHAANYIRVNGKIDKEKIIDLYSEFHSEITDRKILWKKCSEEIKEYAAEHFYGIADTEGISTYRFSTGLAYAIKCDMEMGSKLYKLSKYIRDGRQDAEVIPIFLRNYWSIKRRICAKSSSS